MPVKFPVDWNNAPFTVFVSIYSVDGTVAIAHAGIEMGQGINVKVCVCTYVLCILILQLG